MILSKEKRKEVCAGYVVELRLNDLEDPPRSWPPKKGHKYVIGWKNKHGVRMPSLGHFEVLNVKGDVAEVKVAEERRLLAAKSEYGYTEGVRPAALGEEPEGVDGATQREFTRRAGERWDAHRQEEHATELAAEQSRRLADKILKLQREAAKLGVDISPAMERFISEAQGQIVAQRKEAA